MTEWKQSSLTGVGHDTGTDDVSFPTGDVCSTGDVDMVIMLGLTEFVGAS